VKYKMKTVKLSDIQVGERFRTDLGNIKELEDSIREKGLIQPICISQDNVLLAGGRRFAACTALGIIDIPCLVRESSDEIDNREVELMENIHRKEMSWQEQSLLTARIHNLYKEKNVVWSGRKTAELLDQNPMNISRALKLATNLEEFPELKSCPTADEALKRIKRAEEYAIVTELTKRQQTKLEKPENKAATIKDPILATIRKANSDYVISDVFEGMEKLISHHKKFNLIECDPPFAIPMPGTNKTFNLQDVQSKLETDEFCDIDPKEYPAFLKHLSDDMYQLAEDDSWMIFWLSMDWYTRVVSILEETGWNVNPTPAVWIKTAIRTNPYPHNLSKGYHPFLICKKGTPTLIKERRNNVFTYPNDNNPFHPHPRPLYLMDEILETFLDSGANIFVPFLGSGITIRAAYRYGCNCMGFDSSDKYKPHFLIAVEEDTKKFLNSKSL
jgi:ParB/RepB/Spo0J family partition protein